MLECRYSNLSKTFFYASFSSILSNSPLNPISNSTIFAWLTSTFIVSAFNSLENFFEIFNMIFYSNFILFATLVSAIAFPLCLGDSKSFTLLTKLYHDVFVDSSLFLIMLEKRPEVFHLCKSLFTTFSFVCWWCWFMSLKRTFCIRFWKDNGQFQRSIWKMR